MFAPDTTKYIIIILLKKYRYDNVKVKHITANNLVNSRPSIDVNDIKFEKLDTIIKNGGDKNKFIYRIKIENGDTVKNLFLLYISVIMDI